MRIFTPSVILAGAGCAACAGTINFNAPGSPPALGAGSATAPSTINWGSEFGSVNVQSDGLTPVSAAFTIQLGRFEGGFTPSGANVDLWAANWTVFDQLLSGQHNAAAGYFTREGELGNNTTFGAGARAYVWMFNNQTALPGSEWLLYTNDAADGNAADDWNFPAVPGDQQTLPLSWRVSNASRVVFGGLDPKRDDPSSPEFGDGYGSLPPGGFNLQTHTFVPEPSAGLLGGLAALFFLRRRQPGRKSSPAHSGGSMTALTAVSFSLWAASSRLSAQSTMDGALQMELITAYNFVVDSNIETPAGRSPSAAHLGVKVRNTGAVPLTNVVVNIGDLIDPPTSSGTPGIFPSRTVTVPGANGYSGTFALQMPGGAVDAVRTIDSLAPGETAVQYFFVTYPLMDSGGNSVAGAAPDPGDDLWLNYDVWATASEGTATRRVSETTKVTMRNEISAMANKIWPNTTSKVPDKYLDAIEASLGWRPGTDTPRAGSTAQLEGIWYDLGNVGAGFDNDGDGLPDRNAWMQPVGDPAYFDPFCARLVKCYGIVIVKVNDGTELLLPFEDQLYFENLPENNTGAVGLVFYEFIPLASGCTAQLTPYQEVASGFDNEKFNSDYGASVGSFTVTPPEVTFDKTGPATVAAGGTATYSLTAGNTGTTGIGLPEFSLPFVFADSIPPGLVYVAGSATAANTVPAGNSVNVSWSTDNGVTWVATEPAAASVTQIRWTLNASLAAGASATVGFQTAVPVTYPSVTIDNTGIIKLGGSGELATDTVRTLVTGNNSAGDLIWKDDDRDSIKDAGEAGIANITVRLHYDADGDGVVDLSDPLFGATQTNAGGLYSFASLPDGNFLAVVDDADADLPAGYILPNSSGAVIAVSLDPLSLSSSPVALLTADWPFIGALEVEKSVTPTTYGAGDLITYTIDLENHAAPVAAKSTAVQTSWSSTVTGNRAAQIAANAQGSPDNVYARIDWVANADNLANSGLSFANPGGVITKVELVFNAWLSQALVDDRLDVSINGVLFNTLTTAQLNAMTGMAALRAVDITSINGSWTWAQVQALSANLKTNKSTSGDAGILWVDSMGFRVTTVPVPPSAGVYGPTTIDPLPLVDTYDVAKLEYVSASVAPSLLGAGTLTWSNLGPLNAGARRTINVVFRALTPPDTNGNGEPDSTTTINTTTSSGARFVSGRPANTDTSAATVTINPRGSIGDLVWWDLNGDGIKDGSEPGIANVLVTLDNGAQARTDANGAYLFSSLVNGTYTVTVDTATLPWAAFTQTKDPDASVNNASTVTINNNDGLSTNDRFLDRDFGYDSSLNVITGTIFQDNDGDGIRDSGENFLAGLTLTLSGTSSATTTTDAAGFYRFGSLANGTYTVTVTPPGSTTQTLDPDATINHATTVVASGGNLYPNRDFAYRPAGTLTLGDTLYLDWNGDGDQDAGEEGIAGVYMFLYEDGDGNGAIDPGIDALIAIAVTDVGGIYGFTGLPAGNCIVVVNTADPQFPPGVQQVQDFDGIRDSQAVVNLTVSLNTVDFGYMPQGAGSIGDTVFIDADGDGLEDGGETGIANVTVTLYEDTNNDGVIDAGTDALIATTTTGAAGRYLFTGLGAGNYLVDVDQNAAVIPDDAYGNNYRLTTTDPHEVALGGGQSYLMADFGFAAPGAIGDFVFFDSNGNGTQDFSETGIPNVTVQLYPDADVDGQPDSPVPTATTVTADGTGPGPAGFYQFTNLGAGTWFVRVLTASLPQAGGQPIPLTSDPDRDGVPVNDNSYPGLPAGDDGDSLVIVEAGSNYAGADFGYQPSGAVGDFVWLDLNQDGVQDAGEPGLAGVTINIRNGTVTYAATTDFDGYWSVANIPDGPWSVSVPAANFASGGALENTTATSEPDGGADSFADMVLAAGMVNLAPGNLGLDFGYALNGSYAIFGTIVIHDTGVAGTADDVDDFFDDGVDQDAGPQDEIELAGIVVYLYTAGGDFLGTTMTDAAGNYSFGGLPGGGYRVIIGTTVPVLQNSTLTTTAANNPAVSSVNASSGTSVIQTLAVSTGDVMDVDFAFVSIVDYDYGDLPLEYGITTLSQDGARHIIPAGGSTLYLGTTPDADTNGVPTALANGDDSLGADDESGIIPILTSAWTDGSAAGGNGGDIQVSVTGAGWLTGWIDWNHDGDFLDPGEFVADQAVSTGTTAIGFDIPAGTIGAGSESWLSRFRIFTSEPAFPLFSYTSVATDGEVEDLLIERTVGASLGDFVWSDDNNDGIQDSGEDGMGGVTVVLRDNTGTVIATQVTSDGTVDVDGDGVTDPAGYYRFRGLSAGAHTVVVTNPPAGFSRSYDEDGTGTANVTAVTLTATEQHLTADFGYAPLLADISGQVRYDTDADGDLGDPDSGAAAVKIQLWTDPDGDGDPTDGVQVDETYTNANGDYLFTGVPTGDYIVMEINPPGSTSTADVDGGDPDRISVAMAGTDVTGRDFLDTAPPLFAISGAVYEDDDATNDNLIGPGDTPLASITVRLYFDRDGDGLITPGDSEISSTFTSGSGTYSFTGLPAGSYIVQETDPAGAGSDWDAEGGLTDNQIGVSLVAVSVSGRDFLDDGLPENATLGDYLWQDRNGNGFQEAAELPMPGVTVFLDFNNDGVQTAGEPSQTTGASGLYSFSGLVAGTYLVRVAVATLPPGAVQTGDPDGTINNSTSVTLAAGQTILTADFGYRLPKPADWSAWQYQNPLGGQNGPGQNPDGDIYSNLLEYAFCFDPRSGKPFNPFGGRSFCVIQNGAGGFDAVLTRGRGLGDVTCVLDFADTLGNPTTWTPEATIVPSIVDHLNGTETLTWGDLEQIPALADGEGYLRVRVILDINADSVPEAASATYVMGWIDHGIATQCETLSNPFLKKEVFSGTADAGSPLNAMNVSGSAVATNVAGLLAGKPGLTIEIISGPLEGHRFAVNVAGSDADTIAVIPGSTLNTLSPVPDLSGAPFVVREEWRFGELFPASSFQNGGDLNSADNLLTFNSTTQTWTTYFLANLGGFGTYWVDSADGGGPPASWNNRIIHPGEGLFVHRRGAPLGIPLLGIVRENHFARPLASGYNLTGGGYPLDQSYVSRGMTLAAGFDGDPDIRRADQVHFWTGDTTVGRAGYNTHYLLDAGPPFQRWVSAADNFVTALDNNPVFKADRATFLFRTANLQGYLVQAPWSP